MLANHEPVRGSSDPSGNMFWGEVSPCDHILQLYDDDEKFFDSLEVFVSEGLTQGDAIVVIATPAHRRGLDLRLKKKGYDLSEAIKSNRYTSLDATETLSRFMKDEWPDDEEFENVIRSILIKARGDGRHVRAFGEMVALLWSEGRSAATVRLEYLWNNLCRAEGFSLFCAYPKIGFTSDPQLSLEEIRAAHSRII
jgi:hypothetical protein